MKYFQLAKLTMAFVIVSLFIFLNSCNNQPERLPILGEPFYKKIKTDKGFKTDTIYPFIPKFSFLNQENKVITNETFRNKIYIADFFFLSCPTICPKMTKSMKRVYDHYAVEKSLLFVSYSIDPNHDTPELLKNYAHLLGVSTDRWHFLTGSKEAVYELAVKGFYSPAYPDNENPGNIVHSGGLMLVDRNGHLRGVYDGTSDEETDQLIKDINILIQEKL